MRAFLFHITLVLMLVGLASCRPKGVLPSKEMVDLLFDVHLVDAMTDETYGAVPSTWKGNLETRQFKDLAYQRVLKKHGVSESEFYTSVAYYSKDLRKYTRIYSDVDKRFREYIESIENWSFHEQSVQSVKDAMAKDSLRVKALFTRWHILPDTLTRVRASYKPDSVSSWVSVEVNRWLREPSKEAGRFLVVDTVSHKKQLVQVVDSLQQVAGADSCDHETWAIKLLNGEVEQPTTPPVVVEKPLKRRFEEPTPNRRVIVRKPNSGNQ